ncbi:MAG: 2-dehydropantoate 2-reductase N-terminal domain-containing protein, partial [Bacteroidota bacterium]|nr:2-dehydropantoate 2-reductase N-terminal domain-containing protein [Bacteroidota bacterium]
MTQLRYAVIGTGALGGFYGGMLAKAGKDVHFLFNRDFETVQKNGLIIDSVLGNYQIQHGNFYH